MAWATATDEQPENASHEKIPRELARAKMGERGLADTRAGGTMDNEEALGKIRSWRN